jgi:hypothetical protein
MANWLLHRSVLDLPVSCHNVEYWPWQRKCCKISLPTKGMQWDKAPQLYETILINGPKNLVANCLKYWPRATGQHTYLSWQKKPKEGRVAEVGGGAIAWVCAQNGRPIDQQLEPVKFGDIQPDKTSDGFFILDEGGEPMRLLLLPPSVPLKDANTEPSVV